MAPPRRLGSGSRSAHRRLHRSRRAPRAAAPPPPHGRARSHVRPLRRRHAPTRHARRRHARRRPLPRRRRRGQPVVRRLQRPPLRPGPHQRHAGDGSPWAPRAQAWAQGPARRLSSSPPTSSPPEPPWARRRRRSSWPRPSSWRWSARRPARCDGACRAPTGRAPARPARRSAERPASAPQSPSTATWPTPRPPRCRIPSPTHSPEACSTRPP